MQSLIHALLTPFCSIWMYLLIPGRPCPYASKQEARYIWVVNTEE